jgi:CubicO group peptidase (beta-lactamase class C family)
MTSERIASFRASLETQTADLDDAALSVAILHDAQLVWTWSRGMADRERSLPVTEQTAYPIASVYKSFIATGILQLYEAGALRLDDPITELLPWFRMRGYDPDDPIRIRHLLSHTAGLPNDEPFPVWTTVIVPDNDSLRRALAEQELIFPPGYRTKYSNLGYTLLGLLVESATKTSLESYLQQALLSPLGIPASSFGFSRPDFAQGYGPAQPGGRCRSTWLELRSAAGGGGLSLTFAELARFAGAAARQRHRGHAARAARVERARDAPHPRLPGAL